MTSIPQQVRSFDDIIKEDSLWTVYGVRRPSKKDFKQKRVAIRKDLVENIIKELESKHFCTISGPKDTGKSWLCISVAVELRRLGRRFQFVIVDDSISPPEIWDYMKEFKRKKTDDPYYWFVEDCHLNRRAVQELIGLLQTEPQNLRFVFTVRSSLKGPTISGIFDESETCEYFLGRPNKETVEHVKDIIKSYIDLNRIAGVTEDEIDSTAEKWGGNLADVSLRLKNGWRFHEGMRLCDLRDDDVYSELMSPEGKTRLAFPNRRRILLNMSAICQFEPLSVWEDFLRNIDPQTTNELEREGVVERLESRGQHFLGVSEAEAEWILKALSAKFGPGFVQSEIKNIFKAYIRSKPPNWTSTLCVPYLRSDSADPSVADVLISTISDGDVWKAITDMVQKEHFVTLESLTMILRLLRELRQEPKADDVWFYVLRKTPQQTAEQLSTCPVQTISDFLLLAKGLDLTYFDAVGGALSLWLTNLEKTLQRASVANCCRLCHIVFDAYEKERSTADSGRIAHLVSSGGLDTRTQVAWFILDVIEKRIKSGSARNVTRSLPPLNGIRSVTLTDFFKSFNIIDWKTIIGNSVSFDSVYHLVREEFKKWRLEDASRVFLRGLFETDLETLVTQKGATTYRLHGICVRAQELNMDFSSFARKIVGSSVGLLRQMFHVQKQRELARSDERKSGFLLGLNGIVDLARKKNLELDLASYVKNLSLFEAVDLEELFSFCDLEVINFFLSVPGPKNPEACSRIIKGSGHGTWLSCINLVGNDTQRWKHVFWLIWNIYRYDASLASKLAKDTTRLLPQTVFDEQTTHDWLLPMIGLFGLLKVEIADIERLNLNSALHVVDELKKKPRPSCTQILLSLVALKPRMRKEDLQILKRNIVSDPLVKACIYKNDDSQLGSVLQRIVPMI